MSAMVVISEEISRPIKTPKLMKKLNHGQKLPFYSFDITFWTKAASESSTEKEVFVPLKV